MELNATLQLKNMNWTVSKKYTKTLVKDLRQ